MGDLLAGKTSLKPSTNQYDWLGHGIYFWEHGPDRARRFADRKCERPAVIGALIQLGNCFDLLDTRFMDDLSDAFGAFRKMAKTTGREIPENRGGPEKKGRFRDCAVLNWYLELVEEKTTKRFDTVRCGFIEGKRAFAGSGIRRDTHVQIAVRTATCVLGVFRPIVGAPT